MTATYKAGIMGPNPMIARNAPHRRPPEVAAVVAGIVPALDDAMAAQRKAAAELTNVRAELLVLERGERTAAALDAQAFAAARREGSKDPGPVHVQEHTSKLADCQRRQAGMRVVLAGLAKDIDRLIEVHGQELAARVLVERNGYLAEQAEAETAAAAAAQNVRRVETTLAWLQKSGATEDEQ